MSEMMLKPVAATRMPLGRHGREDGAVGVHLRQLSGRALVQVMARGRSDAAINDVVQSKYGITLPERPTVARGPQLAFLWAGHRSWMAMANEADVSDLESALRNDLGDLVSLSDQTDGRFLVELSGPKARDVLAKLAPVDLHPRSFGVNDTAMTLFAHISGQVTQIDAAPTYELMVFRGFADSFLHDVLSAAAEFGVDVSGKR